MEIIIERRAEIALRSLRMNERKQIVKALEQIASVKPQNLWKIPHLNKLRSGLNYNTYVYRGSEKLRLVLSFRDNVCIVEDIVNHDKLNKLIPNFSQQ